MTPPDQPDQVEPDQVEPGVLHLGEQAAQAIRQLNHRTRDLDAFAGPAELDWLLADLAATAQRLPQLLDQLRSWLHHEHDNHRLRTDNDTDPAELIAHTNIHLTDAGHHAQKLAAALDTAHQQATHLAKAPPTQQINKPTGGQFSTAAKGSIFSRC